MNRQWIDRIAPPVYGIIDFAVIMAPSLAVKQAADNGGMGDTPGIDLVIGSLLVGSVHAVVAARRLQSEERVALRRLDMWIAALNAIVVLSLLATLLLVAILVRFADEHSSLANRNYPVLALWVGVQVLAVAGAEATGRFVFWWLEPDRRERKAHRRGPSGPRQSGRLRDINLPRE